MSINHVERAFQAWPVLTRVSKQAIPTITYGRLGAAIGIHHRAVRYVLAVIQDYCLAEKLPPLTILVVNGDDGRPGEGFIAWDIDDLATGVSRVVEQPWDQLSNPFSYAAEGATEDALADELVSSPANAADVYARVKVRGVAQSVFRKALLLVYENRCAMCGLTMPPALEAAHLVPWSAATGEQRMATTNGILLCSTHHRFFDCGLMTISPSHSVACVDPKGASRRYSEADIRTSIQLHGRSAYMPTDPKHQPVEVSLAHHHRIHGWKF